MATAMIASVLFVLPLVLALVHQYEGFAFANESIAYRWGHPSRVSMGDVPPILPQGFTILAMQQFLVRAIEWFQPLTAETLRSNVQWFCWGTLLVLAGSFLPLLIAMARTKQHGPEEITTAFLPWLVSVWATGSAGLYYCLLPDYYHLNAILACVFAWLLLPFLNCLRRPGEPAPSFGALASLGALLGLAVANKITWGLPCFVALSAVLMVPGAISQRLARGAVLCGTALLTLGFVLLAYCQFSPRHLAKGVTEWIAFMKGQQGEFALWSPTFYNMIRRYNYDLLYPLQAATLIAALVMAGSWRSRLFTAVCCAAFTGLLWATLQRPAGTTFWDINVLTLLTMAVGVLAIGSAAARRWIALFWIGAVVALVARQPPTFGLSKMADSREATDNRFETFSRINHFAAGRPQLIVFLNNEYHHEGVHELLLKAASDFPSWNITVGQAWLDRILPRARFFNEYAGKIVLPDDFSAVCVVWFDRPDLPPLEKSFDALSRFSNDPDYERISLPIYESSTVRPRRVQVWVHAIRRKLPPAALSG